VKALASLCLCLPLTASCAWVRKQNEVGYYKEGVHILSSSIPIGIAERCKIEFDRETPDFESVEQKDIDGNWGRYDPKTKKIKYEKSTPEVIVHEAVHYILEGTDEWCAKEVAAILASVIYSERKVVRNDRLR